MRTNPLDAQRLYEGAWEEEMIFETVEELAREAMGRAVCLKHSEARGALEDPLCAHLDAQGWKAYLELGSFLGVEEAKGTDYVVRFLCGALTRTERGTFLDQDLEQVLKEATEAAGLEYIPPLDETP